MTVPDDEHPLASDDAPDGGGPVDPDPGWPWSFILLVVAGAIYLIFRFVEIGVKLLS